MINGKNSEKLEYGVIRVFKNGSVLIYEEIDDIDRFVLKDIDGEILRVWE